MIIDAGPQFAPQLDDAALELTVMGFEMDARLSALASEVLNVDAAFDELTRGFDALAPSSTAPVYLTDRPEELAYQPATLVDAELTTPATPVLEPVMYPPVRQEYVPAPAEPGLSQQPVAVDPNRDTAGRRTHPDPRVRALAEVALEPSALEEEFATTAPTIDDATRAALAAYDPADARQAPPGLDALGVSGAAQFRPEMAPGPRRQSLRDATHEDMRW